MLTARAAYPYADCERAAAGRRGQLRVMAAAGGGAPDWSTFSVEGPVEVPGVRGRIWFEWAASVAVVGGRDLTRDPLDADPRSLSPEGEAQQATMPQPPVAGSAP